MVHDKDVVQRIPPGADYTHVGEVEFIDADGHWHMDARHLPAPTRLQEWAYDLIACWSVGGALAANAFGLTIPEPIADHAPIYYASHIWNNQ